MRRRTPRVVVVVITIALSLGGVASANTNDGEPQTCPDGTELVDGECQSIVYQTPVCPDNSAPIDGTCPDGTEPTNFCPEGSEPQYDDQDDFMGCLIPPAVIVAPPAEDAPRAEAVSATPSFTG